MDRFFGVLRKRYVRVFLVIAVFSLSLLHQYILGSQPPQLLGSIKFPWDLAATQIYVFTLYLMFWQMLVGILFFESLMALFACFRRRMSLLRRIFGILSLSIAVAALFLLPPAIGFSMASVAFMIAIGVVAIAYQIYEFFKGRHEDSEAARAPLDALADRRGFTTPASREGVRSSTLAVLTHPPKRRPAAEVSDYWVFPKAEPVPAAPLMRQPSSPVPESEPIPVKPQTTPRDHSGAAHPLGRGVKLEKPIQPSVTAKGKIGLERQGREIGILWLLKLIANAPTYVVLYLLFMVPTYLLPYVGSNSAALNAYGKSVGIGFNPAFWWHLVLLLVLCVLAWARGTYVAKTWLIVFPIIASVFDLVAGLNLVPFVPTIMHLCAIIVGVSSQKTAA